MTSQLTESERIRLKHATRALVKAVGGIEAAERLTRVDQSSFSRYQSLNHVAAFMPADIVADLERVAEAPIVTAEQASINGHILVPKPAVVGEGKWFAVMGQIAADAGRLIEALGEGLRDDGAISKGEAHRLKLRGLVEQLQVAAAQIEQGLNELEKPALKAV